ncbi:hypothetical protein LP420_07185 [Massilia sp. B-10]|nr:hypothetical protein LP420_07185 [Massilia sp. B-10]UUZ57559.1 hypothetical protein LP419_06745 [Massilia sp. H-1]
MAKKAGSALEAGRAAVELGRHVVALDLDAVIEGRHHQQGQDGRGNRPANDGNGQRTVELAALAQADGHRQHA